MGMNCVKSDGNELREPNNWQAAYAHRHTIFWIFESLTHFWYAMILVSPKFTFLILERLKSKPGEFRWVLIVISNYFFKFKNFPRFEIQNHTTRTPKNQISHANWYHHALFDDKLKRLRAESYANTKVAATSAFVIIVLAHSFWLNKLKMSTR